ncbi:hypothetical protein V5799_024439 [Amblyomma americanum]|uniref:Uncharacterized protein n=1 Tax=Amblyomma americanum TaxID=6943 RepID=A0AAQ4EC11_AMBAM
MHINKDRLIKVCEEIAGHLRGLRRRHLRTLYILPQFFVSLLEDTPLVEASTTRNGQQARAGMFRRQQPHSLLNHVSR